MNKLLAGLVLSLLSVSVMADHHAATEAEVRDSVTAFNAAYAENRIDEYFSYYADDAVVYFYGARQDLDAYYAEWKAMDAAGGGVEKNEMSDLRIQLMPGGDVAVASYFVDYRFRSPEGDISAAKAFETEVWQKIEGAWKVVNLHYSEIAAD
jgi:ketosteroid isomerase-like protein